MTPLHETWGPLTGVRAAHVPDPDLPAFSADAWAAGVRRHQAAVAAHPTEWDGSVVSVASVRVAGGGVIELEWWEATWAELLWRHEHAASRAHPAPPFGPEWSVGLGALVWLTCADGLVAARRSTTTHGAHGQWFPSATEGVEVGEMAAELDLAAIGRRACEEELGVTPDDVTPWRWQQLWRPGWRTRLYLLASTSLTLAEVRAAHTRTPDGRESDALAPLADVPTSGLRRGLLIPDSVPHATAPAR